METTTRQHKKHVFATSGTILEIMKMDSQGLKGTEIMRRLLEKLGNKTPSYDTIRTFMPSSPTFDPKKVDIRLKSEKMYERRDNNQSVTMPVVVNEFEEYVRAVGIVFGLERDTIMSDLVRIAKKVGAANVHAR